MEIEDIWNTFLEQLQRNPGITDASWKKAAGIPFLYIHSEELGEEALKEIILRAAGRAMRGKQLHAETVPVRKADGLFVYRHRFYVPQRKMFCCGNLCPDCIRFTTS